MNGTDGDDDDDDGQQLEKFYFSLSSAVCFLVWATRYGVERFEELPSWQKNSRQSLAVR